MDIGELAQTALAQLCLDQESDLERRGRAFVGHPGDADDDPTALEGVERAAQPAGRLGRVEMMRFRFEVLDLLGHDARAGGKHELLVAKRLAGVELDRRCRLVDPDGLANDQLDPRVEQRPLRSLQAFGALPSESDVHEAGLVDMAAQLVDDGDVCLGEPVTQHAADEVGDDRAANPAAENQYAFHLRPAQ